MQHLHKIWFNQINPIALGAAKLTILKKIFQERYKSIKRSVGPYLGPNFLQSLSIYDRF